MRKCLRMEKRVMVSFSVMILDWCFWWMCFMCVMMAAVGSLWTVVGQVFYWQVMRCYQQSASLAHISRMIWNISWWSWEPMQCPWSRPFVIIVHHDLRNNSASNSETTLSNLYRLHDSHLTLMSSYSLRSGMLQRKLWTGIPCWQNLWLRQCVLRSAYGEAGNEYALGYCWKFWWVDCWRLLSVAILIVTKEIMVIWFDTFHTSTCVLLHNYSRKIISQEKAASPPLDTSTPMTWLMTTLATHMTAPRVER
jgi:hypothetical protein